MHAIEERPITNQRVRVLGLGKTQRRQTQGRPNSARLGLEVSSRWARPHSRGIRMWRMWGSHPQRRSRKPHETALNFCGGFQQSVATAPAARMWTRPPPIRPKTQSCGCVGCALGFPERAAGGWQIHDRWCGGMPGPWDAKAAQRLLRPEAAYRATQVRFPRYRLSPTGELGYSGIRGARRVRTQVHCI